jgi:DNA end-binding protein Ku
MARPAYWNGYLKLSLVTCPVQMTPATTGAERIRFHTVNRKTGNRVRSRYVDVETGEPVEDDEQVMGYEVGDGEHVLLEDEELDAVALESVHTIDIDAFVDRGGVDRIWLDKAHYLLPADEVGEEAFAVIREAMRAADVAGLSKLVLGRREHRVMLEARGKGILLWTLRYRDQVRDAAVSFDFEAPAPSRRGLELAGALIEERTRDWGPDLVEDRVQANLETLIAAKARDGSKPAARRKDGPEPTEGAKVISIMDALKRSLAEAGGKGGRKKR